MKDRMRKEKSTISRPNAEGKQKLKKVNFVMSKPTPKWKPQKSARVDSGEGGLVGDSSLEVEILKSNPLIIRAPPSEMENVHSHLVAKEVAETLEAGYENAAKIDCSRAMQTLDPGNANTSGLTTFEKAMIPVDVMETS
ncbi:OLC1v1013000C1 [Oldenlandia corymbosa var. corymbosa]|uniref:OLC1v1013000C1 n=1 Tax=Oldenlandia corymbosa var. corymbosa TaxID=529605 RepID=A0AAV1DX71_OLDCO|nr:OLC1v1013000C1 [Oldenlandia corymbosa var. corymbosa]